MSIDRRVLLKTVPAVAIALAAQPLQARARFVPYPRRDDVRAFIDDVAERTALAHGWIEKVLAKGKYLPAVERLMQPPIPYGQRNWNEYRARYVDEVRINAGVGFHLAYREALARAEEQHGVPAEIVVAIIGVETLYGRTIGTFRTLDVLLTLSFDYLRRADYFRGELEQFLVYAQEQSLDPAGVRGSFAGAIGIPQFMPSSIRKWAVDFDGDGRIDLVRSAADSIGSVANFLREHGWQRGEAALFDARLAEDASVTANGSGNGVRADTPWATLAARGVQVDATLEADTPVLLVDLPVVRPDGTVERLWRVGTRNFAALLGYNRSYFYAASVVELGAAIRARIG